MRRACALVQRIGEMQLKNVLGDEFLGKMDGGLKSEGKGEEAKGRAGLLERPHLRIIRNVFFSVGREK